MSSFYSTVFWFTMYVMVSGFTYYITMYAIWFPVYILYYNVRNMVSGLHIILQCTQYGFRFTYYITMYAIWFPVYILHYNVRNMVSGLHFILQCTQYGFRFTYYITMYVRNMVSGLHIILKCTHYGFRFRTSLQFHSFWVILQIYFSIIYSKTF